MSPLQSGGHPHATATGDFNEDGILDLAATNIYSSSVSIFLATSAGNGFVHFGVASDYRLAADPNDRALSVGPESIVVGDFNGDKHLDFVTANSNNEVESVTIRLGDGRGNFGASNTFPVGKGAFFVAAADFNRDGKTDVAVATRGGEILLDKSGTKRYIPGAVSVLSGNGSGGFSAPRELISYPKPLVPTSLATGDFNEDGSPDLAAASSDPYEHTVPGTVSVLLSRGASGLGAARDFPPGVGNAFDVSPAFVVSRDFDGDGNLDLALAGKYNRAVSLLLGDGAGGFGAATNFPAGLNAGWQLVSMAAGDFNGDGDMDLVVADGVTVTIIPGKGDGNFAAAIKYPDYPYSFVTVADFNRDHKLDVALSKPDSDLKKDVDILFNSSGFTPMPTPASGPSLLTAEYSERAIALDSVTLRRDPFPVCTSRNFSADRRTRVTLFAAHVGLTAGGDGSSVTAQAEDTEHVAHPLAVEFVGQVPNVDGLTEIIVKLPDSVRDAGNVWISIEVRGVASNKVLVRIEPSDCAPA